MALATSDIPTVSIVSLLADRRQFIPLLRKCVELQTYPKEKIEWVIVDDGQDIPPETFDKSHEIYVQLNKKLPLGRKRQLACDLASGEFIFFFDDDDLHFPHRIERGVNKLRKTGSKMIAGNSALLLANTKSEKVIQSGPFNKIMDRCLLSAKNTCNTAHFAPLTLRARRCISQNWSIPMAQMHPQETIIALAHSANTVDKDKLFENAEVKGDLDKLFGKQRF